jgi:hypothetical protein
MACGVDRAAAEGAGDAGAGRRPRIHDTIAAAIEDASVVRLPRSSLSDPSRQRRRGVRRAGGIGRPAAMSEPRVGRVLVASLHQAIADLLPMRLDFYENWLNASGLREGTIGLAPLSAVLSFLRNEGDAYNLITGRAGEYAADWTVDNLSAFERRLVRTLPSSLRARVALRTAGGLVRASYPGSRAIVRLRRGRAAIDLRGSLFCEVREATMLPLCGFYAAAFARVLQHYALSAETTVHECRAAGARKGCQLHLVVNGAAAGRPAAA